MCKVKEMISENKDISSVSVYPRILLMKTWYPRKQRAHAHCLPVVGLSYFQKELNPITP